MAVLGGTAVDVSTGVVLSSAQAGTGDSTNTARRGLPTNLPASLLLSNTAGASPTVTINILGSVDGTNFYNVPYARGATSSTIAVAAITVTSTNTEVITLQANNPWLYLKLNYSANTNETITATFYG